jgi:YesN/AraC family two-component response regulator
LTNFNKYKYAYVLLGCTLIISIILHSKNKSTLDLLSKNTVFSSSYTDQDLDGNSTSSLRSDTGLIFNYSLGENYLYAFAGISIDVYVDSDSLESNQNTTLDLSTYKNMEISMKTEHGKKIPVQILTYLEGYSVQGNNNTLIFYEQFLEYDPKLKVQSIPFERFAVPNWWRKDHPNVKTDDFKTALQKVKAVNVQSCIILPKNTADVYSISSIFFSSKNKYYLVSLVIGIVISAFIFMMTYFKQKKMVVVSYKQIQTEKKNKNDGPGSKVMAYINEHYADNQLSVESVETNLNLAKNKLSETLREESNLSFKQYLNAIRILEAKRLLSVTNLSISEIAYEVGYSNISHFNRVFKSLENCSPSVFKENNL